MAELTSANIGGRRTNSAGVCSSYTNKYGVSPPFGGHATLTNDLWAYYTMEAADGDDATGNHDATPSGTPPNVTTGKNGNGLDFTTNAYYLDIETPGAITDYTVSGWFYMLSARGFDGTTHVLSDPVTAYLIYFDTNGKPGYHGSGYLTHTDAIGTDGWHHVVWSAETTTGAYYVVIDGDWAGRKYAAAGATTTLNPSIIAASDTGTNDFDGYIDELGIWSRVLTQQEVEDLYNSGSGLFY